MTESDEDTRKITWQFRLWYLRHAKRRHRIVRETFGPTYCAKCLIVAPEPRR